MAEIQGNIGRVDHFPGGYDLNLEIIIDGESFKMVSPLNPSSNSAILIDSNATNVDGKTYNEICKSELGQLVKSTEWQSYSKIEKELRIKNASDLIVRRISDHQLAVGMSGASFAEGIADKDISDVVNYLYPQGLTPVSDSGATPSSVQQGIINKTRYSPPKRTGDSSLKTNDKYKPYANNLRETLGGADLTVFFMAEVPNIEDIVINGSTAEQARKELIMMELDNVLSLTYSTIREKFPVRKMGNVMPSAYTYGPRTLAGTIAFAIMAEDVLEKLRNKAKESMKRLFDKLKSSDKIVKGDFNKKYLAENEEYLYSMFNAALNDFDKPQLLDSLPPFHLLVMGKNENGLFSKLMLKHVSIIDENQYQGTTQPNIVNKCSFVALDIVPLAGHDSTEGINNDIGSNDVPLRLVNAFILPDLTGSSLLRSDYNPQWDNNAQPGDLF